LGETPPEERSDQRSEQIRRERALGDPPAVKRRDVVGVSAQRGAQQGLDPLGGEADESAVDVSHAPPADAPGPHQPTLLAPAPHPRALRPARPVPPGPWVARYPPALRVPSRVPPPTKRTAALPPASAAASPAAAAPTTAGAVRA